ncbi:unnamed protein product [Allacma fusca]|uniref:UBX domain-containing protein n=1 Tax=Allacma fusca TaxID=39272 RepID=A0A8J2LNZ7_9HEXA|nr:unnamed protein product [Allacma fusca]
MSAVVNRDEVLADFQACTGIDDVGEALSHLEEANWDLLHAINRVLPPDTQALPSERHSAAATIFRSSPFLPMDQDPSESDRPVRRQTSAPSTTAADLNKRISNGSETSSDVEDLTESYPTEEDFFDHVDEPISRPEQTKYLIADNAVNETAGTVQFAENFVARYGDCHPMFFQGTLEEAFREATNKPARDRKLLALYLHHDGSVFSNVFCTQILCAESIVSYVANNFVVWGWDVTHESNRQLLLTSVQRTFGDTGIAQIRSFDQERYPVIFLVSRVRSQTEFTVITSNVSSQDDLLSQLINVVEAFKSQQVHDIKDEKEREARELVKREQDAAYEASLNADRAKDEAKRALEVQKQREEEEHLQQLAKVEAERASVARSLPPEPGIDCKDPVCSLKCRMPAGKVISRRFLRSNSIKVLFDFLFTEGYSRESYKFLTTYPKRDLTTLPDTSLMKDVFSVQDTLIVEER